MSWMPQAHSGASYVVLRGRVLANAVLKPKWYPAKTTQNEGINTHRSSRNEAGGEELSGCAGARKQDFVILWGMNV